MNTLEGSFTALVTPFSADGAAVDHERLAQHVARQAAAGVTGVVPCGTTGETPTLTGDECRAVIEMTVDAAHMHGLRVIAGAGSNATARAVAMHRFAAEAGADAALHVTPYYNKPSQEGLYRHFMTIADAAPLPVMLYNIPGRAAIGLTLETIQRIGAHPNVVAVKEASGSVDFAARIVEETTLTVLSGDDPLTLPLATVGARGVVSVLSNLVPDRVAAMCRAFLEGDWASAVTAHRALLPLARALLTLDSNPVPLKTAMRLLGLDTGAVRPPLCPCSDETTARLEAIVRAVAASAQPVSA